VLVLIALLVASGGMPMLGNVCGGEKGLL